MPPEGQRRPGAGDIRPQHAGELMAVDWKRSRVGLLRHGFGPDRFWIAVTELAVYENSCCKEPHGPLPGGRRGRSVR